MKDLFYDGTLKGASVTASIRLALKSIPADAMVSLASMLRFINYVYFHFYFSLEHYL
jgi:hypothetical protein